MEESKPQKRLMLSEDGSEIGQKKVCLTPSSAEEERRQNKSGVAAKSEKCCFRVAPPMKGWTRVIIPAAELEDWDKVYSYEEKRLKFLAELPRYHDWEKLNSFWEIENGLVPYLEEKTWLEAQEVQKLLGHKREKLAAEGRCFDGSYLTPYCRCDKKCYRFDTSLEYYPPEYLPIWLAYCRQYRQSHCFDIDDFINGRVGPLNPSQNFNGRVELLMELANHSINDYNEKEYNVFKYRVMKIEKVNCCEATCTYWMTVKVSNLILGSIETFQIHAGMRWVTNDKIIFCCRPKEEVIIGLPSCEFCFGLLPGNITEGKEPQNIRRKKKSS